MSFHSRLASAGAHVALAQQMMRQLLGSDKFDAATTEKMVLVVDVLDRAELVLSNDAAAVLQPTKPVQTDLRTAQPQHSLCSTSATEGVAECPDIGPAQSDRLNESVASDMSSEYDARDPTVPREQQHVAVEAKRLDLPTPDVAPVPPLALEHCGPFGAGAASRSWDEGTDRTVSSHISCSSHEVESLGEELQQMRLQRDMLNDERLGMQRALLHKSDRLEELETQLFSANEQASLASAALKDALCRLQEDKKPPSNRFSFTFAKKSTQ